MLIRNPVNRTPPTILMVIPLAYQDGRDCYTGILEYLAAQKIRWNVILIRERMTSPILKRFLLRGIDGIIFSADMLSDTLVRLVPPHIPCVVMDAVHPEAFSVRAKLAFVDIDSAAIGRLGADHLFTQGNYASFGIIGYTADCNWSESRVQSFCQTMKRRNRSCEILRVRRTDLYDDSAHAVMQRWARRLHRPAAVMAVSDELARQFIECLSSARIPVPQDIAVLGVDNESILCTHMTPTLSSIQPDFERSGYLAAECMEKFLRSRGAGRAANVSGAPLRQISPVKDIVERESTAPASSAGLMVRKAETFIRDHADGKLRVADVARHLGISRRLLDLRFREITGRTVLAAIQAVQLERVRHLLHTTNLSIAEIGRLVNFRSENHLKRLFKATYGMTMSAARRIRSGESAASPNGGYRSNQL